jgi:hypothetical protein
MSILIKSNLFKLNENSKNASEIQMPFSETGNLDDRIYQLTKKMNPGYALCNCPVTSYKTAYLLENGELPNLNLSHPNKPRPMTVAELSTSKWAKELFSTTTDRSYIYIENCSKNLLELIMQKLGKGTHALIGANWNWKLLSVGHCFNYVLSATSENTFHFVILDGYSPHWHKYAIRHPNQFLSFFDTQNMEVVIFFKKTQENIQFIDQSFNK